MAKRATAEVIQFINNHAKRGDNKPPKRVLWREDDRFYFHAGQIEIGTRLLYYGRIDHGDIWTVEKIKHFYKSDAGVYKYQYVDEMVGQGYADDVLIRCLRTNELRQISFRTISTGVNWWLADWK
jgi:hypothetical protein